MSDNMIQFVLTWLGLVALFAGFITLVAVGWALWGGLGIAAVILISLAGLIAAISTWPS
jgi:hypothetical protein